MSEKTVLIVVSGGAAGFGHEARCSNLARELQLSFGFATKFERVISEKDIPRIKAEIMRDRPRVLVIDVFNEAEAAELLECAFSLGSKTVLLSDYPWDLGADLRICPGPHGSFQPRPAGASRVLGGIEYSLLNRAFLDETPSYRDLSGVFLNMGGSFDEKKIEEVAKPLIDRGLRISAAVPRNQAYKRKLQNGVEFHFDAPPAQIRRLILGAEVSITSCGLASLEVLALGGNLAVIPLNPLQQKIAAFYEENYGILNLGPFDLLDPDALIQQVSNAAKANQRGKVESLFNGSWRVAREIVELSKT